MAKAVDCKSTIYRFESGRRLFPPFTVGGEMLELARLFRSKLFGWPCRLTVRTRPFQGRDTGSIPVRVIPALSGSKSGRAFFVGVSLMFRPEPFLAMQEQSRFLFRLSIPIDMVGNAARISEAVFRCREDTFSLPGQI